MARIALHGEVMYTEGNLPTVGRLVLKFTLTGVDWTDFAIERFSARRKVIDIVPSIDVPAFGASLRHLAERLRPLADTLVLLVSNDLPFAAQRWLATERLGTVTALSAFRSPNFARACGVAIVSGPLKGLLARATLVLDHDNQVLHAELAREILHPPNHDAIVASLTRPASEAARGVHLSVLQLSRRDAMRARSSFRLVDRQAGAPPGNRSVRAEPPSAKADAGTGIALPPKRTGTRRHLLPSQSPHDAPRIGIIANPVSARDIRRIVANASNLQIADRANIVLRVLTAVASLGVPRVLMMPDKGGIRAMLLRHLQRERNLHHAFPEVEFLDMDPTSTVEDTFLAARMMRAAGVSAIVVLGGDGTHRAVVRECGGVPIAGLSTGTNNAFPEMRESTITAMAVGLYATGRLTPEQALAPNKVIDVSINEGQRHDIALVDAVVSTDRYIGARALWKTESLAAVYLTFADPQAIGLSAIGGLLCPVGRREAGGLAIQLSDDPAQRRLVLSAPIAPGMVRDVGIAHWEQMPAGREFSVALQAGIVALDGEREMAFDRGDRVRISLRENAFPTVDVARCMQIAAELGLLRHSSPSV